MENSKVFAMSVAKVYPLLVAKAERKGRTKAEVDEVTCWLTGYTKEELDQQLEKGVSYETFFAEAPQMNPNCHLIKGSICGIKVELIEDPLMQKIRWLDKLVDELAKGKAMEKILRQEATAKNASKQKAESAKWICPSCGREFKKKNQDHYCGEKPKTIDAYIEMQEPEYREDLYKIRQTIKDAIPEAEEKISWSMPTYWKKRNLIHFAAFKKHIGLYPGPEAVEFFAEDLKNYKTDKGTIRIPYGKIDVELVAKIARWCFAQVRMDQKK